MSRTYLRGRATLDPLPPAPDRPALLSVLEMCLIGFAVLVAATLAWHVVALATGGAL